MNSPQPIIVPKETIRNSLCIHVFPVTTFWDQPGGQLCNLCNVFPYLAKILVKASFNVVTCSERNSSLLAQVTVVNQTASCRKAERFSSVYTFWKITQNVTGSLAFVHWQESQISCHQLQCTLKMWTSFKKKKS